MAGFSIEVDGEEAFRRAMDAKGEAITMAVIRAVGDSMTDVHRTMANFLRVYSHPLGTPTPSPPGHPPAIVTGSLIRSIKESGPDVRGTVVTGSVQPTIVYARIQERGGRAGRNHAATLPARPYVLPTAIVMRPRAWDRIRSAVALAVRNG